MTVIRLKTPEHHPFILMDAGRTNIYDIKLMLFTTAVPLEPVLYSFSVLYSYNKKIIIINKHFILLDVCTFALYNNI